MNRFQKTMLIAMFLFRAFPGTELVTIAKNDSIPNHIAASELNTAQRTWFNSSNAAGMTLDPLWDYNILSASFANSSGEYRSLQRGKKENSVNFNTNGALRIGKVSLWGDFSFTNDYWKDAKYNTNLFSPSSDMPYYVADANEGDWNKQLYDMGVKAAFPLLWNTLALGVRAKYTAYKGAKQIDPRGVPIGYAIEAEPSIAVKISDRHSVGAAFFYRNGFERSTFSNVQGGNSSIVYLMKGLGNFSSGAVSGTSGIGNYYYPSNTFGGSVQYGYTRRGFKLLAEGSYRKETTDAFQNPNIAYRMGTAGKNIFAAGLRAVWNGKHMHILSADCSMSAITGTEYLQEPSGAGENDPYIILSTLDMSTYNHTEAGVSYDVFIRKDNMHDYTWNFGIKAEFCSRSDRYNAPVSVFSYSNMVARLHAARQIRIKERHRIAVKAEGGYRYNLSGEYIYGGADPGHKVVTEFYTSEHRYLSASLADMDLQASYYLSLGRNSLGFTIGAMYLVPDISGSRTILRATVSYLF